MPAFDFESSDGPIATSGGGVGAHEAPTAAIGMTQLADTDYVDIPVFVPEGMTLTVKLWSARTDTQGTPTGLSLSLYDYGSSSTVFSEEVAFHADDSGFATLEGGTGGTDASLRLNNNTGGQINAGGFFGFEIK